IAAAEQDRHNYIDGVAVTEPSIEMPANPGVTVQSGDTIVPTIARTLFDFTSYANLYQPGAALSAQVAGSPGAPFIDAGVAAHHCASLQAKGLLTATTLAGQADEALQKLRDYGWEPDSDVLHASLAAFEVAPAVTVTFGNALARASVKDNLCGFSFGAVSAAFTPAPLDAVSLAQMFATGTGVPPSSNVQLINNLSPGVALRDLVSFSPSTLKQDFNLDGANCLRELLTGSSLAAANLRTGIDETRRNGDLNGKPTI